MNGPFGLGGSPAGVAELPGSSEDSTDSLVAQLHALYQEKQELQAGLGVSTSAEIIQMLNGGKYEAMLKSLTDQLISLYAERQEMEHNIGCSSAVDVIEMVTELRTSIRALVDDSRRRLQYEATLLETHERFLA